jgi:hypothetical protein
MLTDRPPRNPTLLAQFLESDRLASMELPAQGDLRRIAVSLDESLKQGNRAAIQQTCTDFLDVASDFYKVERPNVKILAARPLRVRENTTVELFGDYHLDTMIIRVWTRTAVRKRTTTFGTFLSTLCHEFCHHLDGRKLGFRRSPHTRGFYQRAALLYHHARATPVKSLPWIRVPGNRWRINWQRMRAVSATRQLPRAALHDARMSGQVRAPDEALRGPLDGAA